MSTPPQAKRVPHRTERHGHAFDDEWAWLADRDDPDTLAYLVAENAYTDEWFEPRAELVERIVGEIKDRTLETDLSVPVRKGAWWYLTRTVEGSSYPLHLRRSDPLGGEEQLLLDQNAEASGHDYFALGAFDISPSGRRLAWSSDVDGDEVYRLRVRDLDTGEDLADVLERTYYGTAWSADECHLFYIVPDDAMRPYQVWRHEIGTTQGEDALVLQEDDERFFLELDLSRSEQVIVIASESKTSSEVHVLAADDPTGKPRLIEARAGDVEYTVEHQGHQFVILTNDVAEDFRVVAAPVDAPGRASWTELVAPETGRRIHSVDAFDGYLVLHEWHEAMPRLRLVFDDGTERVLELDEAVHAVGLGANPEYRTERLRFEFQSLVTPRSIYDEDVRTGQRELLKQTPVLGGYDSADYSSARTWADAPDGTRVPIDLVWKRSTPIDGTAPAVLYGYGAYEVSVPPWFSIARLSLLDRGVVWALTHPRGGGELGRRWYLDGRLANKRNSFTDLIASAEHLVSAGFARRGGVAVRGASAGGLLVGAAMAERPDLFAAVVAEVPFVDVVNTMLDASLPLTVTEWEEWGDPRDAEDAKAMLAYSPYDNVRPAPHPPMLVTAGLNDPRVAYHEPAKWVAKLRAAGVGEEQPLLLKTELGAGHGGPSGRYAAWREEAKVLAFLLTVLGAT